MTHQVRRTIGASTLTLETGSLARQADGAVTVRYGDTVVLVTAVGAPQPREMQRDFFPLLVDYREKLFAAGKIPGGRFYKREGRPSLKEVVTGRMIDRPIRTLFPKHYRDEVQVMATVLSADRDNDPDIHAVLGASAAVCLAGLPFGGPVGVLRVARAGDQFILNPTNVQLDESDINVVVAATRKHIVMVEAECKEAPDDDVKAAIEFALQNIGPTIEIQEELVALAGKPRISVPEPPNYEPLLSRIRERYYERILEKLQAESKRARHTELNLLYTVIEEELLGEDESLDPAEIRKALEQVEHEIVRSRALAGQRIDGRAAEDLREISCEVAVLPRTHGSALFRRGETQALVVATLGTNIDEEMVEGLYELYTRKFMLQYNHPAFSVGEVRPDRGPGRREIGHGNLAERSLKAVMPSEEEFPYTIRVVSDILESNGSTSMATVCGGTLCLMDAGVPIKRPVAGISIGLVCEGDRWVTLNDIAGHEDHHGDMDFKVAGTQKGITAIQMDLKIPGITMEVVEDVLKKARETRLQILRVMLNTLSTPRDKISPHAPKLVLLSIPQDKIGNLIGPGGRNVRRIEEETGCKVEIEEDGTVTISSPDSEKVDLARKMVEGITAEPQVGEVYDARVVSIKDFGCFVEILPGVEGLVHVSELGDGFVKQVSDVVKIGDGFKVKLVGIDDQGRLRLSKRAVDDPNWQPAPRPERRPHGMQSSSGGRGSDRGGAPRRDSDRRGGRSAGGGGRPRR